jgi:hypothetical protein
VPVAQQPHCACSAHMRGRVAGIEGVQRAPSPTLSPTDPVPRGLLTLCPLWPVVSVYIYIYMYTYIYIYIYIYIYKCDMGASGIGPEGWWYVAAMCVHVSDSQSAASASHLYRPVCL